MDAVTAACAAHQSQPRFQRRLAAAGLSGAGAALLAACASQHQPARPVGPEPPPETTTLRLAWTGSACQAPQYVAEDLLRAEGFVDLQYVDFAESGSVGVAKGLGSGRVDITMNFVGPLLIQIEAGDPIVFLAGGHVGCLELVATDRVRAIRDLKGKTVAVNDRITSYIFFASMLSHVGLHPERDLNLVVRPAAEAVTMLAEGQVDAFFAFPPYTQELRAKQIGHVVVSTAVDRPWSQYYCCLVAGNRDFVRQHPVATKRALRAILKGAEVCATEPARAAQSLADHGYTKQYDFALQLMKDLPYSRWREYDPEDTLRYYALRLQEAGMIKSGPNRFIERATDWRFLNELKRELKV
jgi:NitT/TauT family transport system substrate-binding protein